jgi:pseudaminic acid biosynthesis-associated methylase
MEKLTKGFYGISRTALNKVFLDKLNRSMRILEVGSNIGNQLLCLQKMGFKNLYGIEPLEYAVELSKKRTKGINIIQGNVFDLPFKDNYFDLVFTSGVLIHINPKNIKKAIREIYRCTSKYIWGLEYYSERYQEIIYRENKNLLWKGNFVEIYKSTFPSLKVCGIRYLKYLDNDNIDVLFLLKK